MRFTEIVTLLAPTLRKETSLNFSSFLQIYNPAKSIRIRNTEGAHSAQGAFWGWQGLLNLRNSSGSKNFRRWEISKVVQGRDNYKASKDCTFVLLVYYFEVTELPVKRMSLYNRCRLLCFLLKWPLSYLILIFRLDLFFLLFLSTKTKSACAIHGFFRRLLSFSRISL